MSADRALVGTEQYEALFLGLTEEEAYNLARDLGVDLLVRRTDDELITADLRSNRITLEIRQGRVHHANAG